jgi:hypothetical protein
MFGKFGTATLLCGALALCGCGQSTGEPASATSGAGPEATVSEFLAAVKKGDDKHAADLLTTVARQKTTEMEMVVAPPGSDTASFKILESEVEGNEAQVGTDWTDLDADGRPHTDRIVWMLRKEAIGWRICGMATRIYPDMPPVILNFEDPADMMAKQQAAEEEIARRESQIEVQSADGDTSGGSTIR